MRLSPCAVTCLITSCSCPSLIIQHFLQKYWFAVLSLSACVPGAVAVMKRLHRKALEIPSVLSRSLSSKQRFTARKEFALCDGVWARIAPRLSDTGVQLQGCLLGSFWSLTGHWGEHQAAAAELEKQRQDLRKDGWLANRSASIKKMDLSRKASWEDGNFLMEIFCLHYKSILWVCLHNSLTLL